MLFAGIDYHKRYSVVHVLDADGATVKKGRVEPNSVGGFAGFFSGFPDGSVRAVFESSMNWKAMVSKTRPEKPALKAFCLVLHGVAEAG